MPAADYQAGGIYWDQVQDVIRTCGCSRLRAVSALKACRNDAAAAIASLKEIDADTVATRQATIDAPIPLIPSEERAAPSQAALSAAPLPVYAGRAAYRPNQALKRGSGEESEARNASKSTMTADESLGARPLSLQVKDTLLPYQETAPIKPTPTIDPLPPTVQWDFRLPEVHLDDSEDEFMIEEGKSKPFSPRRLMSVLQHGMPLTRLQRYLSFFSITVLRERINEYICGYPAIFYVVATNDPLLIRAWAECGGDVNAKEPFRRIPVLAFATLMSCASGVDSTKVVVELLSLGADISSIPPVFFSPYIDDPTDKLPLRIGSAPSRNPMMSWCVEWIEPIFAREVNLTQRYFLEKTSKDKGPTDRQLQVAQIHGATSLLGVSSFLIGQTSAARTVTQKLLAHMALPRSKPLVMVFAGPSGHGKTELAWRMGQLLSLEIECVDCTEMKYETDLFGPKKPYIGYDVGSPLNNFLTRLSGKRCIVFLDEFEKTTTEVRNSLLIPFDEGRHVDRRNRSPIDCTRTIWVIATNAVDHTILNFCDVHKEIFDDDPIQQQQLANEMSVRIKKQLKTEFGNPLSGRITAVIPFLPFTPGEAAVVAHKYVLELKDRVKQSISASGRQLVGHILLEVRRDGAICSLLASEGYDPDQGARSLKGIVDSKIEDELIKAYLEEDGQIQDQQPLVRYVVDLTRNEELSIFKAV